MVRRCCWPTAVPMDPGDVPTTPDGIRAKELVPQGREPAHHVAGGLRHGGGADQPEAHGPHVGLVDEGLAVHLRSHPLGGPFVEVGEGDPGAFRG